MTNLLWLGAFAAAGCAYLVIAQKWPFQPRSVPNKTFSGADKPVSTTRQGKVAFGKR